ncbi:MAG: hypothetical protein L0221_19480 [Chloroflexi bacterium]|nr:hypothetical protein [Chloroflexota bacterium]
MPTIDPAASALEALAAHLEDELGSAVAAVLRGWPEANKDLDLSTKPSVSVTAGTEAREPCAPRAVDESETGGVTTYYYRVGFLTLRVQVDLWAPYSAQLDEVGALLEAALAQAPPLPPELRLTQGSYYDRPITAVLVGSGFDHDGDTAAKGEWRRRYELELTTDLIRSTTHAPQVQVDVELTTTDIEGGSSVTETFTVVE